MNRFLYCDQKFKLVTKSYLRITSSKLHSEDSWDALPLLASGEVDEARGGGEAKYGGDRGTVWMLKSLRRQMSWAGG